MFKWKVKYLECLGCCSIYETVEEYTAWTKYGVWKQFLLAHPELPISYTDSSHFENFVRFIRLVERA